MRLEFDFKSMVIALLITIILMVGAYRYRDHNTVEMQAQIDATQEILSQLQLNKGIGDAFRGTGYDVRLPPPPVVTNVPKESEGK